MDVNPLILDSSLLTVSNINNDDVQKMPEVFEASGSGRAQLVASGSNSQHNTTLQQHLSSCDGLNQ